MKLYDNHNHSQFSFDGKKTTVEKSVNAAMEMGLSGICFTDHCDFFIPPCNAGKAHPRDEVFDADAGQAEMARVRDLEHVKDSGLEILSGIEVGVEKGCRDRTDAYLAKYDFDQIIVSAHYVDGTDLYTGDYYDGKDWKYAYGHYIAELYREARRLGDRFDIFGHFDYVVRYAPYPRRFIGYNDFPDLMDEVLRYLAHEGKALEINTKTYRNFGGRRPVLDVNILKRFKEFGGETLSLGSDSHDATDVGYKLEIWAEYLKSLGFKYEAHYKNRRLVMTNL